MSQPSRVEAIFFAALEKMSAAERAAYLDEACAGDADLRRRVERLLEAHPRASDFLARPAIHGVELETDPESFAPAPGDEGGRVEPLADDDDDDGYSALAHLRPSEKAGSLGRLAHYEVLEVLGRGTFGTVVKAFDEKLHRHVAVKLLAPILSATSASRKRFVREARTAAAVRHENVIAIYCVEEHPIPYLVMEYLAGRTLQQRLDRSGPPGLEEVLGIGRQLAAGLSAAHDSGLVHRDIKPGNILIEDVTGLVKLTDFGLARAVDDASLSLAGAIAGTPMYMAPEQARGESTDQRSDLFSLGSVLYALCTGRPPFRGETSLAVLKQVVDDAPRPIRELNPDAPGWLCDLIAGLHAKDPADRIATARDVADRLARGPSGPVIRAGPAPADADGAAVAAPATRPRGARRYRRAAAAICLIFGGLGFAESAGVTDLRGTAIRIFSRDGTLVVEVEDPEISVQIEGSDVIITGAGAREIRLTPGRYVVDAIKHGEVLRRELVHVARNGRQVLRISQEAAPPPLAAVVVDVDAPAPDWERAVASQPINDRVRSVIGRLKRLNPGLDGISFHEYVDIDIKHANLRDVSPLRAMPGLRDLHLSAPNLEDVSPLRGLALTRLDLFTTRVTDLSPVATGALRLLDLSGSAGVTDLTPLRGLGLESLTLYRTGVTDLSPLRSMRLEVLNCDSTGVTDLSPLAGAPLTALMIVDTPIADLTPIRGARLLHIRLRGSRVTDLSPLRGMPLETIECDFQPERDAPILRAIETLRFINGRPADAFWRDLDARAARP